nr:MAG TPA: hypothetical protein [Bacteriophage sp.]DAJ53075.1 MAG TPA: hypothetical protein [Caudoviricetes sp.]
MTGRRCINGMVSPLRDRKLAAQAPSFSYGVSGVV